MQSKMDSVMEVVTNTAIGMLVSYGANIIIIPAVTGAPLSPAQNLTLGALYTAVSLVRGYVIRRAFNGRSPWTAIKGAFA